MAEKAGGAGEAMAARHPLPEKMLLSVEYPGYVGDADKAVLTLGGSRRLGRSAVAGSGAPVELRYRYNDLSSHPINGQTVPTQNLLIKVTRRVKRTQGPDGAVRRECVHSDARVVAVLDRTVRFRRLADFQYIASDNDMVARLSRLGRTLDVDEIKRLGASDPFEVAVDAATGYLPAPFLDHRGWPAQYQSVGGEAAHSEAEAEARRRRELARQGFNVACIKYQDTEVPTAPTPAASKDGESIPAELLQRAQRILDECPVVSRSVMETLLPPGECGGRKASAIMPMLAYLMYNGPWRNCWIRLGYDPRTDPGSCKYQVLDIRYATGNPSSLSASRAHQSRRYSGGSGQAHGDSARDRTHVYDAEAAHSRATGIFQFMHVEVQPLRDLIDYSNGRRQTPCEYSGWLQPSVMRTMRTKLKTLKRMSGSARQEDSQQTLAVDYGELDRLIAADREAEEAELASEQMLSARDGFAASGGQQLLPQAVRERVEARVDQSMRALRMQDGDGTSDESGGEFGIFDDDDDDDDDDGGDDDDE
ncbi:tau 95 subunit of transcription factor TFIIIC [Coemansia javaensis]|uniref:Tau 95 subunit of transcription factor TFIIIC n=1 Tax=Coemansia javaensis TaxID=2761396 RepID=A0A9W8H916_9FUNG|nr:tau 95 subunit of transcription factor TFIIIC [Coemansia javaensis]